LDPQQLDDRALYDRVAQGSSDAATWSEFVARFSKLCYHAFYRVIARYPWTTPADADELFQKLFEHLLADDRRALKRYRGENGCSPRTWLAHVAAYRALEHMRKHEKERRGRVRTEEESDRLRYNADHGPSPEEELERERDAVRVRNAVDTLSASDKLFYQLHYERGMSLTEISRFLSKSETAVHIQHFRLKERLRRVLVIDQEASP
jgi:RNA polymerase sigma factor (sigma-70 family)